MHANFHILSLRSCLCMLICYLSSFPRVRLLSRSRQAHLRSSSFQGGRWGAGSQRASDRRHRVSPAHSASVTATSFAGTLPLRARWRGSHSRSEGEEQGGGGRTVTRVWKTAARAAMADTQEGSIRKDSRTFFNGYCGRLTPQESVCVEPSVLRAGGMPKKSKKKDKSGTKSTEKEKSQEQKKKVEEEIAKNPIGESNTTTSIDSTNSSTTSLPQTKYMGT